MTKEAILLHFVTIFACDSFQMSTTASFDCHPSHNHQNTNNYFDPSVGLIRRWHQSKQILTVKSDTDIPAIDLVLSIYLFICFVLFIFYLSYFLSIVLFFFFCLFVFFVFFILFINLRTCNSIYILTRLTVFCENPKQMLNFQPKVKLWAHKRMSP